MANKYSTNGMVEMHYVRKTRYWFLSDGKIVQKIEENESVGRKELSRETSVYKYDAEIKIEAPPGFIPE